MKKFLIVTLLHCAPKKIGITLCFTLCIMNCAFAQAPLVKIWDKDFGGTDRDWLYSFQPTHDGGFILGGTTLSSAGGDKTQPTQGGWDYWIVKTDSLGNKLWDKDFGGTADEYLTCVLPTSDGGYLLGGYSNSGISGDKTQPGWGANDYWIIKTDSLGTMQWDRDFGGTAGDWMQCIYETADGGFILGGTSTSGISGNKTQPTKGTEDYWIIKTDSSGNIQWDVDFGGADADYCYSVKQTTDGGYILGGTSWSAISGDKSEPLKGALIDEDYWIIKTDSMGTKQWDRDFGGTDFDLLFLVSQTTDNGYVLGGLSFSGIGGDKSEPKWAVTYTNDYWIVKTDGSGIKLWDKDLGGTSDDDEFCTLTQMADGGYLVAGNSYSPISGNKTENNMGTEQSWVLKTDSVGNVIWDKTILTNGHSENGRAIRTADGCYVIANYDNGSVGGYKSQPAWNGLDDYWMIKFCDTTASTVAAFTAPYDLCPGTCIDFTNLSQNASTYLWSFSGATPPTSTDVNPTNICYPTPGSYDVQLIANNTNGSDTLTLANYITVYPSPPPQGITQSGDTLFAIAGATSYQWYFNGNIINGATGYFYVAPTSGDYNVVATDVNGCEVEAVVFNVVASVDAIGEQEILIFPNPVEEKFTLQNAKLKIGTAQEISIYNVLGEKIYISAYREPLTVNCEHFPSGLYYLEIKSSEKIFRTTFVKSTHR